MLIANRLPRTLRAALEYEGACLRRILFLARHRYLTNQKILVQVKFIDLGFRPKRVMANRVAITHFGQKPKEFLESGGELLTQSLHKARSGRLVE